MFYVFAGRFPGEGGIVAPGMSCKYTVRFAPDSLGDYEDFITVEMQMRQMFVVPIVAKRPAPVLTCESFSQKVSSWLLCSLTKFGLSGFSVRTVDFKFLFISGFSSRIKEN